MTDEEPQLRYVVERCRTVLAEPDPTKVICPNCTHQFTAISVADQERLRAQSNAEPVAWQWRMPNQDWPELSCGKAHAEYMRDKGAEIRPVFAAPPRPDALEIKFWQEEAAKWAKMFADERRNHEFEERWPRPDTSVALDEIEAGMDRVLERRGFRLRAAEKCDHQWVDARNKYVESGEVCPKCGAIRAQVDNLERRSAW